MPAARWQTPLTEARRAPLPFALLSFSYAAYFLAALIALFAEGGVSESEEWRVFIVGWPTIPLAALAAALAVGGLKRARHADAEAFYPLLLTANALCWVGYFAYCFPPPWLYDYQIDEQALYPLLWLLPLINLLVLFAFNRGLHLLARTKTTGLYALLPIAALYVGFNFTGYRIEDPELLNKTWWPQISSIEGRTGPMNTQIVEGQKFYSAKDGLLSFDAISKRSTTLHFSLPWALAEGSRLTAWHVEEGDQVEAGRVLAEFESEFFHSEIRALMPIRLGEKGYQIDDKAAPTRALFSYFAIANDSLSDPQHVLTALLLGLVALFLLHLNNPFPHPLHPVAVDAIVILATALLVFDTTYAYDDHHYNFYLGPINDVLHGKSLLVDINCQYGVGVIYALAVFFKLSPVPLNYQGFALLLHALLILQYALVYLLACRILGARRFAAAALLLVVAANYFSQEGAILPSTGPLRFGLAYLLLALLAVRDNTRSRTLQTTVYALVGLASLWSFESFIYTLAAYASAEFYLLLCNTQTLQQKLRRLLPLIVGPAVAIAAGHLLLALCTWLRAGTWPDWSHYFAYLTLYSVGEFGTLTVQAWHPWALFIAVYFLSLLMLACKALLAEAGADDAAKGSLIAGFTGFGIVQFTYYLGRSHHNNLFHICIPLVLVATYWLLRMHRCDRHVPKAFARGATYCYLVAGFLLLAETGSGFFDKWPHSPLGGAPAGPTPWSARPFQPEVIDALTLIERYAADRERIALFLHPERTTETLMLSQKTHIFPMSNPMQDDLLPSAHDRVLRYEHDLQQDDYLFVSRNTNLLNEIQQEILDKIMDQMRGFYADATQHVYAIRLYRP